MTAKFDYKDGVPIWQHYAADGRKLPTYVECNRLGYIPDYVTPEEAAKYEEYLNQPF